MSHGRAVSVSAVSLTLAVAATAMWVHSHDAGHEHRGISEVAGYSAYHFMGSRSGQLVVKVTPNYPAAPPDEAGSEDWRWCREYEQPGRLFSDGRRSYAIYGLGIQSGDDFLYDYFGASVPCRGYALTVPYGVMVLVFAVLPGRSLIRHVRGRYRRAKSLCVGCGYDLRASSDRCPECGRTFARHRADSLQKRIDPARRRFEGGGAGATGIM